MKEKKKDAREEFDFDKDVKYQREQYAKDDLIDTPYNKAKRYKIASEGVETETSEEMDEKLHKMKPGDLPAEPPEKPEDKKD